MGWQRKQAGVMPVTPVKQVSWRREQLATSDAAARKEQEAQGIPWRSR